MDLISSVIGSVYVFDTNNSVFDLFSVIEKVPEKFELSEHEWIVRAVKQFVTDMELVKIDLHHPMHLWPLYDIILAMKIIFFIKHISTHSLKSLPFKLCYKNVFEPVKKVTKGWLHCYIKKAEFEWMLKEPLQAPARWSCKVCGSYVNSHMTLKTQCNHFIHISCASLMDTPECPECSLNMF